MSKKLDNGKIKIMGFLFGTGELGNYKDHIKCWYNFIPSKQFIKMCPNFPCKKFDLTLTLNKQDGGISIYDDNDPTKFHVEIFIEKFVCLISDFCDYKY